MFMYANSGQNKLNVINPMKKKKTMTPIDFGEKNLVSR